MKRFFPYYSLLLEVKWTFICSILLGVISGVASGFGLPLLLQKVLPVLFAPDGKPQDLIILDPATGKLAEYGLDFLPVLSIPADFLLIFAIALLPTVFLIRGASMFGNTYLLNICGISVLEGIRMRLFSRLQDLHLDFFRKHKSGDLLSRTMGDTMLVKNVLVEVTNDMIIQPFTLVGAVGFVIWQAFQSTATLEFLQCLALVPITVLPVRYIGKRIMKRSKSALESAGEVSAILTESLQAPKEIRAYNLQARERIRFQEKVRSYLKRQLKVVKYDKALTPLIEIVSAATVSFAVYRAAIAGLEQETVIALVGALYFAYDPIKKLGKVNNRIKEGLSGLSRLEEIIYAPIEVKDPETPKSIESLQGEVVFKNVDFSYDPGVPVLKNVSFSAKPGETIALVGHSGAGKSTVANLIPRFYDPSSGEILIDGINIRELAQNDLRKNIAIVSQEPILFADTIYNNILLGKPDASEEEVVKALKRASAFDFVSQLENGWNTLVGERGGRLSGGQRQRIAIARAFLKNAPILILDEATSALDSESEAEIQEALEELVRGRTTFMIAHRFSSIRTATKIMVFDCGKIIALDTHDKLYQNCPLYQSLYNQQK